MDHSAGLLMYRWRPAYSTQVLLVHPGGPYWQHRDKGWWSIPKGKVEDGEEILGAAMREFEEELGFTPSVVAPKFLGTHQQSKTKKVSVFAFEGEWEVSRLKSNTCEIEYPAGSGKMLTIPEIDRASWFKLKEEAYDYILPGQRKFLYELAALIYWEPWHVHYEEEVSQ